MVKICDVVDGCEDCPKYGDDCDGDKRIEPTDDIKRADAIEAVRNEYEAEFTDLPDIPRYYYEKVVGKMAHEINMLREQLESADRPRGEWYQIKDHKIMGEGYLWHCSICDYKVYQDSSKDYPTENYCPNCGARMKGGEDE